MAYHQAGHALVASSLPDADPVHKVTIVARGAAGGYTRMPPEEDRTLWSKGQFEAMMAVLMGGQAAEELVFGDITTGASNDLESFHHRYQVGSYQTPKRERPEILTRSGALPTRCWR